MTEKNETDMKKSMNLPVSKKFYDDLCKRVAATCQAVGCFEAYQAAMAVIDNYLMSVSVGDDGALVVQSGITVGNISDNTILLIFTLLRSEIDRAIVRSASARRRAGRKDKQSRRGSVGVRSETVVSVSQCQETAVCPNDPSAEVCRKAKDNDCRSEIGDENDIDDDGIPAVPLKNRRQRRREQHAMKRIMRERIKPLWR